MKPDVENAVNVMNLPWSGFARCPACGTAVPFPDDPKRETRHTPGGPKRLLVDVRCTNCPATMTLDEKTGELWSFIPWRNITVKIKR